MKKLLLTLIVVLAYFSSAIAQGYLGANPNTTTNPTGLPLTTMITFYKNLLSPRLLSTAKLSTSIPRIGVLWRLPLSSQLPKARKNAEAT